MHIYAFYFRENFYRVMKNMFQKFLRFFPGCKMISKSLIKYKTYFKALLFGVEYSSE